MGVATSLAIAAVATGAGSTVHGAREQRKAESRAEEQQRRAEEEARALAALERQAAAKEARERTRVEVGEDPEGEEAMIGRRARGRRTVQPSPVPTEGTGLRIE